MRARQGNVHTNLFPNPDPIFPAIISCFAGSTQGENNSGIAHSPSRREHNNDLIIQ